MGDFRRDRLLVGRFRKRFGSVRLFGDAEAAMMTLLILWFVVSVPVGLFVGAAAARGGW